MGSPGPLNGADVLVATASDLLERVRGLLRPDAGPELAAMRVALHEPLRIALAGRVSAGKSTLANALLGRRVAPTKAGECTQVVTWYRFGSPDRADLLMRDGSRRPLRLDAGLPEQLGVDPGLVARIEVVLQSAPLRSYTLVDTPGLSTMHRPDQARARRDILGEDPGDPAAGGADAVVFLFRDTEKRDDIDFIRYFHTAGRTGETSAFNVIGVLSHADLFGAGPWGDADPIDEARGQCRRMEHNHADALTAVLPVAGLLAEAARTGRVTESDARGLAALAEADRILLQLYPQLGPVQGADAVVVDRILRHAGPYVLDRGRAEARGGGAALRTWLDDRSGINELEQLIWSRFTRRARPLKVDRLLRRLERLSHTHCAAPAAGAEIRDFLEVTRMSPAMHRIEELRALGRLAHGGPEAGPVRAQLARLIDFDEPSRQLDMSDDASADDLRAQARRLAGRSQAAVATARSPVVGDAARVLSRSYQLLARTL
jgi:hypothetical protein